MLPVSPRASQMPQHPQPPHHASPLAIPAPSPSPPITSESAASLYLHHHAIFHHHHHHHRALLQRISSTSPNSFLLHAAGPAAPLMPVSPLAGLDDADSIDDGSIDDSIDSSDDDTQRVNLHGNNLDDIDDIDDDDTSQDSIGIGGDTEQLAGMFNSITDSIGRLHSMTLSRFGPPLFSPPPVAANEPDDSPPLPGTTHLKRSKTFPPQMAPSSFPRTYKLDQIHRGRRSPAHSAAPTTNAPAPTRVATTLSSSADLARHWDLHHASWAPNHHFMLQQQIEAQFPNTTQTRLRQFEHALPDASDVNYLHQSRSQPDVHPSQQPNVSPPKLPNPDAKILQHSAFEEPDMLIARPASTPPQSDTYKQTQSHAKSRVHVHTRSPSPSSSHSKLLKEPTTNTRPPQSRSTSPSVTVLTHADQDPSSNSDTALNQLHGHYLNHNVKDNNEDNAAFSCCPSSMDCSDRAAFDGRDSGNTSFSLLPSPPKQYLRLSPASNSPRLAANNHGEQVPSIAALFLSPSPTPSSPACCTDASVSALVCCDQNPDLGHASPISLCSSLPPSMPITESPMVTEPCEIMSDAPTKPISPVIRPILRIPSHPAPPQLTISIPEPPLSPPPLHPYRQSSFIMPSLPKSLLSDPDVIPMVSPMVQARRSSAVRDQTRRASSPPTHSWRYARKRSVKFSETIENICYFSKTEPSVEIAKIETFEVPDTGELDLGSVSSKFALSDHWIITEKNMSSHSLFGSLSVVLDHIDTVAPSTLEITIMTRNLAYEKLVHVRYTTDKWATYRDLHANFQSVVTPNMGDYKGVDRFMASIDLEHEFGASSTLGSIEFAIRYQISNAEYWDNNGTQNYRIVLSRPLQHVLDRLHHQVQHRQSIVKSGLEWNDMLGSRIHTHRRRASVDSSLHSSLSPGCGGGGFGHGGNGGGGGGGGGGDLYGNSPVGMAGIPYLTRSISDMYPEDATKIGCHGNSGNAGIAATRLTSLGQNPKLLKDSDFDLFGSVSVPPVSSPVYKRSVSLLKPQASVFYQKSQQQQQQQTQQQQLKQQQRQRSPSPSSMQMYQDKFPAVSLYGISVHNCMQSHVSIASGMGDDGVQPGAVTASVGLNSDVGTADSLCRAMPPSPYTCDGSALGLTNASSIDGGTGRHTFLSSTNQSTSSTAPIHISAVTSTAADSMNDFGSRYHPSHVSEPSMNSSLSRSPPCRA